ncbi:hypothetical protein [Amycolatopsis sp. cmx-4-68]|uniref:hypothetical protein n=1 Tax=Amycolatopsis sp. cmx-4-68 TaxID=2790938 RepID=UPI00397AB5EB
MNDQPREEKVPEGPDQPTVEQPTAQTAAAEQPTTQQPAVSQGPPAEPGQAGADTAAGPGAPAAAGHVTSAAAPGQAGTGPDVDAPAAHGQQPPPAPPTPQLSQPGPGQAYGAWGASQAAPPRQAGGFRRFVGHRATQLVGVGVLGLLIGGGIVGGIAAATSHGPRDGRPGIHRQYGGPNGSPGFDGRGFGDRGGHSGNSGDSGNSGSGNGI